MTRVKRGVTAHRRHHDVIKSAKGMRGLRGLTYKTSQNAVMKAGQNAYVGRRLRKRQFRSLWIARINAACRPLGVSYSRLIAGLTLKDIRINRKMLSELAVHEPAVFQRVVEAAK